MAFLDLLRKTDGTVEEVLEVLLPGSGAAMHRLRRQTLALVKDPLAHGALILGPAGSGKSSLARGIALCRYLYYLTKERARQFLRDLQTDGPYRISAARLPWFEEHSLPILDDSVADAQLFGYTEDVTPGATRSPRRSVRRIGEPARGGRIGIFEVAARGHMPPGEEGIPDGARATGGVVLLDEIGDMPLVLQPKLLSVLMQARVYRVGGEGREECGFVFRGLTLAATWQTRNTIRDDLRARLSDHVLQIPSLAERTDQLPVLCHAIVEEVKSEYAHEMDLKLGTSEAASDRAQAEQAVPPIEGLDKTRLQAEASRVAHFSLTSRGLEKLLMVPWEDRGELRGLSQAVRRIVLGSDVEKAIEAVPPKSAPMPDQDAGHRLLATILALDEEPRTLLQAIASVERSDRAALVKLMHADIPSRRKLAEKFGLDPRQLTRQLADLKYKIAKRRSIDSDSTIDPATEK